LLLCFEKIKIKLSRKIHETKIQDIRISWQIIVLHQKKRTSKFVKFIENHIMTESELYQKWLDKLEQFCASQERCNFDVRTKMIKLKVPENDHKHIIEKLTTDGFINEERFTKSFVRGKINYKKDGKTKIRYKLIQKQIPAQIIQTVLADFQDEIYTENIERLVERKWVQFIQKNEKAKAKEKLINYMRGKGYSYNEIQVVFRTLE